MGMSDDEAKFLIDQFNKYASWDVRSWEVMFPFVVVIIAANALLVSTIKTDTWVWVITAILAVVVLIFAWLIMRADSKKRSRHKDLLLLLEDYRSKHKALPETITFNLIVQKPKEAEDALLKE